MNIPDQFRKRGLKYLAFTLACLILPIAICIYLTHTLYEWWHFGPSQVILRFLRWLDYKAFKRSSNWIAKHTK